MSPASESWAAKVVRTEDGSWLRGEIIRCGRAELASEKRGVALDRAEARGRKVIRDLLRIRDVAAEGAAAKKLSRDPLHEIEEVVERTLRLWDASFVSSIDDERRGAGPFSHD